MNKRTIATLPRDRYDVQDVLGSGPWGTVVRAKDRKLGTSLAVKTLQNLEPDGVTRLLRLLKLQAGLDHTNLIRLLDVWQAGSRPAGKQRQTLLLTELLTGQTVEDRVRHGGALPVEQAVTITCLALEGLEQLHSREVLHRNIKPSNIFLQGERESHGDHVKVLDYGLELPGLARLEFFEEDHGPGLDEEERRQIFKPFYSSKGARGTGLGLSVTQKVIAEHGGRIEVESEPNKGSLFRVFLPVYP